MNASSKAFLWRAGLCFALLPFSSNSPADERRNHDNDLKRVNQAKIDFVLGNREYIKPGFNQSKLALDSTGNRAFAISLQKTPGFVGEINYIHEEGYGGSNLGTQLLVPQYHLSAAQDSLDGDLAETLDWEFVDSRYWPSHILAKFKDPVTQITLTEKKYISRDDCLIVHSTLHLPSNNDQDSTISSTDNPPHLITLNLESSLLQGSIESAMTSMESGNNQETKPASKSSFSADGQKTIHDQTVFFSAFGDNAIPETKQKMVHQGYNKGKSGFPRITASHTFRSDSAWNAVDGAFLSAERWTNYGSPRDKDWLKIEFGREQTFDSIHANLYYDRHLGGKIDLPTRIEMHYWNSQKSSWEKFYDKPYGESTGSQNYNAIAADKGILEFSHSFPAIRSTTIFIRFHNRGDNFVGVRELAVFPKIPIEVKRYTSRFTILPGEQKELRYGVCLAPDQDALHASIQEKSSSWKLSDQIQQYQKWFDDNVPVFQSSNRYLDKMWLYRWFLVRYNLAEVNAGKLKYPAFYEGRQYYSRVIQFSTPHILDETRWLRSDKWAYGHLKNLLDNQFHGDDGKSPGEPPYLYVNRRSDFYFINWMEAAAWNLYKVHPTEDFADSILPALDEKFTGERSVYDKDLDFLYKLGGRDTAFYATGMEYQPSFYFFSGDMYLPKEQYPDVERVDFSSYSYANAAALSQAYGHFGIHDKALQYQEISLRIEANVMQKMWHRQDHFFYDLLADSDQMIPVKQIIGFYPGAFGMPLSLEGEKLKTFAHLDDPKEFASKYPVPTISKSSDFFSQTVPGGCCHWNGPTWPFSNSIVVHALANQYYASRSLQARQQFINLFEKNLMMGFNDSNYDYPRISESFNGQTGEWKSSVEHYFHSSFNDLVMRFIVGVQPESGNTITFDPIDIGLSHFKVTNLNMKGYAWEVSWIRPSSNNPSLENQLENDLEINLRNDTGFIVRKNGKVVAKRTKLETVTISF